VNVTTNVIADTGTNFSSLPPAMAAAYYAQIFNAGRIEGFSACNLCWVVPCDTIFPTFTFGIGSSLVTIDPVGL